MDGRRARPSRSRITLGTPPSTYATRLLVVPRSMPTMRDMPLLSLPERVAQVIDHGAQVGPGGEPLLEPPDQRRAVSRPAHDSVPLSGPGRDGLLLGCLAGNEPFALLGEPLAGDLIQPSSLRLLEGFLHLHDLLEEVHRRPGPRVRPFPGLATVLQHDEVLDPTDRIPQRPVGAIEEGGGGQGLGLILLGGALVEVRMVDARELVEPAAELLRVQLELPRKPEHREVVVHVLTKLKRARRGPFLFSCCCRSVSCP